LREDVSAVLKEKLVAIRKIAEQRLRLLDQSAEAHCGKHRLH